MKFSITRNVSEKFPALAIGIIIATEIENTVPSPDIAALLRSEEHNVRERLHPDTFKDHPHIKTMQEIHRSFGSNPNKFPPSVQALVKRVLKGNDLPSINPLVDLYNVLSLRYVTCIGAEDTDTCRGDILLTAADGGEPFTSLGETENDPPLQGELVYRDDEGIICRRLNWREGDRTKITETTKSAVIVIEALPPFTADQLRSCAQELAELTQKYCHTKTRTEILTKEHPECLIR
ncbi:MAG: phenylalanine--tRNA ligase beta subunit-related protein [Candidatus Peregrinibacteria bacterium]